MTGWKQAALDACEGLAYETLVLSSSGFERELVERVVAHLRRGSRVLEIGCGSGANLRMLDGRGTGVLSYGCDPSREAIGHVKLISPHHHLVSATFDSLHSSLSFDLVLISFVMHWVDRELLMRAAAEVNRVLRDAIASGDSPVLLAIADFDAQPPHRRSYLNSDGFWTHKKEYSALWAASSYRVLERLTWGTMVDRLDSEMGHGFKGERRSLVILGKNHEDSLPLRQTQVVGALHGL